MAGVYGDMLIAFPEIMEPFEVFKMEPHVGGGYGERHDKRTVVGYWSWRKGGQMGIEGDLRTNNERATFWAKDDFFTGKSNISQGDYVEVDDSVYLVIDDDNFSREGEFTKCPMQLVAGLTDQQHTNTKVDEAIRNDY
jgi:hypothetical protein